VHVQLQQIARRRDDDGFTLIELLVVIIIIGILAAVAIPVFLNQRQKAYDAQAKSDLRELANFEEIYLNDTENSYGTIADIEAIEPTLNITKGDQLSVVRYDTVRGYCLSARRAPSTKTWFYDSRGGGLQPDGTTDCPVTTTGVGGDTVTG
jgi:type IV pilus assembly protein PilA